ncbi:putative receptor-like protein kinase [Nymphaea thermarum]|nr:putative receptor-like protein kinase [Nymphaea thermarum]
MGCFMVLKNRKKSSDRSSHLNSIEAVGNPHSTIQSVPQSFQNRSKFEAIDNLHNERTCFFSPPSSLAIHEQDQKRAAGEKPTICTTHPLPLPSPRGGSLKQMNSFKSINSSDPIRLSGPLPLPPLGGIRCFSYSEIVAACNNFSPDRCMGDGLSTTTYKASFGDESCASKTFDATVVRLHLSKQRYKDFMSEIDKITTLQHPLLCKLIGIHAREGSDQFMLVFERLFHGSLDRLLYGRSDGPPIDWNTRIKIAVCAAQGLAFLHEEGPFQAMYNEFRPMDIQIDKDFSAKLSGYGAGICDAESDFSCSTASVNLPPETVERALVTPKSNVWSFGILLLELITGRQHLDSDYPKEERNLAKWAKAFLSDDCRISLIIDPKLRGRYSAKAARLAIETAGKCLGRDPSDRPTMREVLESLRCIQDIKIPHLFPLQEPTTASKPLIDTTVLNHQQLNLMTSSPSVNGIPSPHCRVKPLASPRPLSLPPRFCPTSTQGLCKLDSPARRAAGVAGF